MRPIWILSVVAALAGASVTHAELKLAGVFADHVVLQRERPIPVWGWGDVGKVVQVEFAGNTVEAKIPKDGLWTVTIPACEASSAGRLLVARCGEETAEVRDVVVGEVWHASGQSNMAWTVGAVRKQWEATQADLDAAQLPAIRFCRLDDGESAEPLRDLRRKATWTVCEPSSAANFSAVAFYFARRLQAELGVPVGILDSSRGGTPIEPFIPRAAFHGHSTLESERELGDRVDLAGLKALPGGVWARDNHWLPGRLFHSRIEPVARFAARGAIWYQGESNCGDGEDPRDYEHKQRALIRGWRQALANEELSFYVVQLPGSGARPSWPYLREQQRLAADLPRTGLAVTIDLEGGDIHPPNKRDVGERLARWALAKDFDRDVVFSGPRFVKQEVRGESLVLHFEHAEGLMTANKIGVDPPQPTPDEAPRNFEITDESGVWKPATAKFVGWTIVVYSPQVKAPIAARYAYATSPKGCNVYNGAGLPAAPFCSRPELLKVSP